MEYGERLTIRTPEGVELDLALAGIGSRFMAGVVDFLIQGVTAFLGALLFVSLLDDGVLVLVLSVGAFVIFFCYDVAFEVLAGGRTPGKRATGLRVVRETGAPVTFVTSAIRNVIRIVDILPFGYGVGMVVVFLTRNNQRLGDLAAGTIIIRERLGEIPSAPVAPVLRAAAPAGWDTSTVTVEDLATVRAFLERRGTLSPGARDHLARDLAARLEAKVAGAPALQPEAFLEQLVAARDAG